MMSRFVIEERINDPAALKQFDAQGYRFSAEQSKPDKSGVPARSRTRMIRGWRLRTTLKSFVRRPLIDPTIPRPVSPFYMAPKIPSINFLTLVSLDFNHFFSVVALIFFNSNGIKPSLRDNHPIYKGRNGTCYQFESSAIFFNISRNFRNRDERTRNYVRMCRSYHR
jgi:hypothetical protein